MPVEIANHFCDYFNNIGYNLAKKIPDANISHRTHLSGTYSSSISQNLTTQLEVSDIINSLRSGTAAGYDNIPISALKDSVDLISGPLAHIINLSISSGYFPDNMKIARVIPLFKSGDCRIFQNYRPISILPIFSKILESVVYKRVMEYINKSDILFHNQYGFRKNHSTSLALTYLCDKITSAIDRKQFTVGIFLDLSKAFDTVNHSILLDKLYHYGIRGVAFNWMKSYLSNRVQFVQYNETFSSKSIIQCGVPQGSILRPLLFLLYINDLSNVSNILELILFADDTNIFFSHQKFSSLVNTVNCEIDKISEWFKANKLSLNLKKSNYVIFKSRQKRIDIDLSLKINDHQITRAKEVVFLGVILDEHISWKPHISYVARKISKSVGIIIIQSEFFPIQIYFT